MASARSNASTATARPPPENAQGYGLAKERATATEVVHGRSRNAYARGALARPRTYRAGTTINLDNVPPKGDQFRRKRRIRPSRQRIQKTSEGCCRIVMLAALRTLDRLKGTAHLCLADDCVGKGRRGQNDSTCKICRGDRCCNVRALA
jgi:hypothetical protein